MRHWIAEFLYRRRIILSAMVVLGAFVLAPRANFTNIDNDITAWFSRQDAVFQDYERFRAEFGGTRTLIIALQSDSLFTVQGLEFIRRVTADIERVQMVHRVHSLASATIVRTLPETPDDPGGLEVEPLIPQSGVIDPGEVKRRALADPLIGGDLVAADARVSSIVVTFDEDRVDAVRAQVLDEIHQLVDPRLPAGMRAFYNGSIEISETYNRITVANTQRFTPPIMVVTLLAIYAMFRSVRKTIVAAVAILVSVIWTLGLYSLLGFTFNVLASMIVPLVIVLAIADDVHIMQHYDQELRSRGSREEAFKSTVEHLIVPLVGASGTTALGMLSLATSDVVAVRAFGIGSALGVMVDFAISIVFVPTLLAWVRPQAPAPQERYLLGPMRRVAAFSTRHYAAVGAAGMAILVVAAAGIVRLRVDTNHINFFSERHPLHQSAALIDRDLSGVYSFQIYLEGPADSMHTPETLARMERLSEKLRKLPFVKKVVSLADYVKRINKELNDGREDAYVVPTNPEVVAQELFVFSLGDKGRDELSRIVSSDYSRSQISVKLASMSSDLVFEQINEADRLAKQVFAGTDITPTPTGGGRLFSQLDHYLVTSQISSFGTAFLAVFGVIILVFRSARFGLLAIVPNLFPVFAVLGVMGWLDVSLNIATVMVASIALGVVDDDTIHFINRYRRETEAGADADTAIETATMQEGRASLTTVIINSFGFGVLMLSEYKPSAWFGGLLALTMGVAFLAEVLILPATIKLAPQLFGPRTAPGAAQAPAEA